MENEIAEPITRVLKVSQCPSVSGRSQLTYQLGCRDGAGSFLRVCGNTGKGAYSKEWVRYADIEVLIAGAEKVTASALSKQLYPGKSTNCGGFLLAVLMDLGLIEVVGDSIKKSYVPKDAPAFAEEVRRLTESRVDLGPDARPADPPGKAVKGENRGKRTAAAPWAAS